MDHIGATPERLLQNLLRKAREQVTGIAARITLDEEERAALYDEGRPAKATDVAPEELLEASSSERASGLELQAERKKAHPATRTTATDEQATDLVEDLSAVRTTVDKAKEAMNLIVAEACSLTHGVLVVPDLPFHDITQPEAPRHRLRRVLVLEDLSRQIHVSHDLEEAERHDGLDSARAGELGRLCNWVRQRAGGGRWDGNGLISETSSFWATRGPSQEFRKRTDMRVTRHGCGRI